MTDQTSKSSPAQPDPLRRKLTKGGLAAPVILATLASKPVLGAVPWTCTISGQLSGNTSGHQNESCNLVGKSHLTLATVDYPASNTQTLVTLFPDLSSNYLFYDGAQLTFTNTFPAATVNQILTKSAPTIELAYAVKAAVLLLNAKGLTDTSTYPLTEFQAKKLYVAAATQSAFSDTNPNVAWQYDVPVGPDVKSYIDVLYH